MESLEALLEAIKEGDADKLDALLAADPALAKARDKNGLSAIMQAAYHRRFDLAKTLASKAGELDIFEAVTLGETSRVETLIAEDSSRAASWSSDGFTALHYAAFFGREDCAKLLVDKGAEVGAEAKNPMRVKPINSAAAARQVGIVRLLLDRGAAIDAAQNEGYTALHSAAHNGHQEMIELLLERGANRAARTEAGQTPADLAREAGREDLARELA